MPQVPRLDGPSVGAQNFSGPSIGPRATGETFGASIGSGIASVGQAASGIADIIDKENDKADQLRAKEVALEARRLKNQLLNEARTSYQGSNAPKAFDELGKKLSEFRNEKYGGLANERQKQYFDSAFLEVNSEFDNQIASHVSAETLKFEEQQFQSAQEIYKEESMMNFTDEGIVRSKMLQAVDEIEQRGQQQGWSPEQVLLEKTKATSGHIGGVMMRHLNQGNAGQAKLLLEKYRDSMDQDVVAKLEGSIKDVSYQNDALNLVETTIKKNGLAMQSGLSLIREQTKGNPELQKLAVSEFKTRVGERQQAIHLAQESQYLSATQYINKNREMPPESMLSTLLPNQRENLVQYYERGAITKENHAAFEVLMAKSADNETFKEFALTDFADPKLALAPSQQEKLRKHRDDLLAKSEEAIRKSGEIRSENTAVKQLLASVGMTKTSKKTEQFYESLGYEKQRLARELRREPTVDEVMSRARDLLVKQPGTGFLGMGQDFMFELSPEDADIKRKMEDLVRKRNLPVNDSTVNMMYRQYKAAQGAKRG